MKLNYFEKDRESFISWMIITLVTQARKDGQEEKLGLLTNKWTDINLTIQVNGVEISPENFLNGVESNMHYWAEQKAAQQVESILDDIREKTDKIDTMLGEVAVYVRNKLENEMGIKFPED